MFLKLIYYWKSGDVNVSVIFLNAYFVILSVKSAVGVDMFSLKKLPSAPALW